MPGAGRKKYQPAPALPASTITLSAIHNPRDEDDAGLLRSIFN
jgi:hypothetical protein